MNTNIMNGNNRDKHVTWFWEGLLRGQSHSERGIVTSHVACRTLPCPARRPIHMATSQRWPVKSVFDQNYHTIVTHITWSP